MVCLFSSGRKKRGKKALLPQQAVGAVKVWWPLRFGGEGQHMWKGANRLVNEKVMEQHDMCNPRPLRSFLNSLCRPVIAMIVIIHKDLSYTVKGVLFDVHNALGPMLTEKFYQAAVVIELEAKGIRCETEKSFEVWSVLCVC